jgi:uroporphyrinogen decarboxylase
MPLARANLLRHLRKKGMPLIGAAAARLNNRSIKETLTNPGLQVECLLEMEHRWKPAVISPFMHLGLEAIAMGCKIGEWDENITPCPSPLPLGSKEGITVSASIDEYIEINRMLVKQAQAPVKTGTIAGPFSLAGRLHGEVNRDGDGLINNVLDSPGRAHDRLRQANDFLKEYLRSILRTGVDMVMILEPSAGFIAPAQCADFSNPYVKELVDIIKEFGKLAGLHNCNNLLPAHAASFCTLGIDLLHIGSKRIRTGKKEVSEEDFLRTSLTHMKKIVGAVPADVILSGNLPTDFFETSTPERFFRHTRTMLEAMREHPNYVPSSACDLPANTTRDNLNAFFSAIA